MCSHACRPPTSELAHADVVCHHLLHHATSPAVALVAMDGGAPGHIVTCSRRGRTDEECGALLYSLPLQWGLCCCGLHSLGSRALPCKHAEHAAVAESGTGIS
jgi:hypothetical protein